MDQANHYWVRLLEHYDRGRKMVCSEEYVALNLKLNMHYSKEANRERCGVFHLVFSLFKNLKTNTNE